MITTKMGRRCPWCWDVHTSPYVYCVRCRSTLALLNSDAAQKARHPACRWWWDIRTRAPARDEE